MAYVNTSTPELQFKSFLCFKNSLASEQSFFLFLAKLILWCMSSSISLFQILYGFACSALLRLLLRYLLFCELLLSPPSYIGGFFDNSLSTRYLNYCFLSKIALCADGRR